jgi:predicted RNase H-like HicB family nuclease
MVAHEGVHAIKTVTIEVLPDPEVGGFTARIPNIPAYGEGETEDEAIADLKDAVRGYIEAFGIEDALARVSSPAIRQLEWDLTELAHG